MKQRRIQFLENTGGRTCVRPPGDEVYTPSPRRSEGQCGQLGGRCSNRTASKTSMPTLNEQRNRYFLLSVIIETQGGQKEFKNISDPDSSWNSFQFDPVVQRGKLHPAHQSHVQGICGGKRLRRIVSPSPSTRNHPLRAVLNVSNFTDHRWSTWPGDIGNCQTAGA